jgi:hypothetical protein
MELKFIDPCSSKLGIDIMPSLGLLAAGHLRCLLSFTNRDIWESPTTGPSWTHSQAPAEPTVPSEETFSWSLSACQTVLLDGQVAYPHQETSFSFILMGPSETPRADECFLSSAEGPTYEPLIVRGRSLELLMAGCLYSPQSFSARDS